MPTRPEVRCHTVLEHSQTIKSSMLSEKFSQNRKMLNTLLISLYKTLKLQWNFLKMISTSWKRSKSISTPPSPSILLPSPAIQPMLLSLRATLRLLKRQSCHQSWILTTRSFLSHLLMSSLLLQTWVTLSWMSLKFWPAQILWALPWKEQTRSLSLSHSSNLPSKLTHQRN